MVLLLGEKTVRVVVLVVVAVVVVIVVVLDDAILSCFLGLLLVLPVLVGALVDLHARDDGPNLAGGAPIQEHHTNAIAAALVVETVDVEVRADHNTQAWNANAQDQAQDGVALRNDRHSVVARTLPSVVLGSFGLWLVALLALDAASG